MTARKRVLSLSIPLLASVVILAIFVIFTNVDKTPSLSTNEVTDFSGNFDNKGKVAYFFGEKVNVPSEIKEVAQVSNTKTKVLGDTTNNDNKWIEVDLTQQRIKAWDN